MCVGFYSENGATLRNHPGQHMVVCGLSLHLGSSESRKTLEQKSTSAFHSINLFLERDVFSSCDERGTKKKNFLSRVILMMTSAQVFETSFTTTDNSLSQGYTYPVDQTTLLHVTEM